MSVRSEHFVVYTNVDAEAYGEVIRDLEAIHAALVAGFFPNTELRNIEVLLFATDRAESDHVGTSDRSTARHDVDSPMVLKVTTASFGDNPHGRPHRALAVKGVFHRMLVHNMRRTPLWFITGLEMFVETIEIQDDGARFGHHLKRCFPWLARDKMVPVAELVTAPATAFYEGPAPASYQASAWAFVHYLLASGGTALRRRFDNLADALIVGDDPGPELSRAAVVRAFPDMDLITLNQRVRDYVAKQLLTKPYARTMTVQFVRPPRLEFYAQPADARRLQEVMAAVKAGGAEHFRAYRTPTKAQNP